MMMRVSVTSLILILSIFCSPSWAQRPTNRGCRSDEFRCEGEPPIQRCIFNHNFCDGYNDCGNNWDEDPAVCATIDCPQGHVKCEGESPTRRCVPPHWMCDGYDTCGNNWDEDPAVCADVTCEVGYYQCPEGAGGRPCIPEFWLCNGQNECGDNSDEDPQVCQASAVFNMGQCLESMSQQCPMPIYFPGMSDRELYEMLVNTDVRELCRPWLVAQECVTEVLASQVCEMPDLDHPEFIQLQRFVAAANIAVNHVCRENLEVFEQHKECLLRADRYGIVLFQSLAEQCFEEEAEPRPRPPCLPTELVDCAEDVVSQQCGQEIAGQLRTLGTNVMRAFGCETEKRFQMKKEMRMHSVFTGKKLKARKTYSPLELMHKAFPALF